VLLSMVVDVQQLAEYRYRAVREVLGGSSIGEVAARYGTSRQTLHSWRRFEQEGMPGLLDRSRRPRSRRPRNSPTRLSAEVEAEICELRRRHPWWGARRIAHELVGRGLESVPSRATVHQVLFRNGLARVQEPQHPRKYRRWQRETPMHLWQMDLVGGVPAGRRAGAQDGHRHGFALAGRTITLRLDGHLMYAIADNALMGTWPPPPRAGPDFFHLASASSGPTCGWLVVAAWCGRR